MDALAWRLCAKIGVCSETEPVNCSYITAGEAKRM